MATMMRLSEAGFGQKLAKDGSKTFLHGESDHFQFRLLMSDQVLLCEIGRNFSVSSECKNYRYAAHTFNIIA